MNPGYAGRLALAVAALAACAQPAYADTDAAKQRQVLHVLNRLAYGPAPGDLDRVMQMGVDQYFDEQLHPESLSDPPELQARLQALDSTMESAARLYAQAGPPARRAAGGDTAAVESVNREQNRIADQAREARLLRALYSPAQLQEVMVEFWFNHFNVFVDKGQEVKIWVGAYERDAIRPHALGKFRDLLQATAMHPAMLYYLDNWQSGVATTDRNGQVRGGLNENYAREVMELHTLGVDGGYSQRDVTELARILTGWTFIPKDLEAGSEPAFRFDPNRHDSGQKLFLKRIFPDGGGLEEGQRALELLVKSPATAHHIAWQLAQYFVDDQPPPKLVTRLAKRFIETDGDTREILKALFHSSEFRASEYTGNKFKSPYRYMLSSVRAGGLPMVVNIRPLLGMLHQNGEPLFGCPTPDGYKHVERAWLNPEAMVLRLNFANALGNGYLPLWQRPEPPLPEAKPAAPMGKMMTVAATEASVTKLAAKPQPPDPYALQATLGNALSLDTIEALAGARPQLRAGLILGSPESMRY